MEEKTSNKYSTLEMRTVIIPRTAMPPRNAGERSSIKNRNRKYKNMDN